MSAPEVMAARAALRAAKADEYISKLVDAAPPFTDEQAWKLRELLRPRTCDELPRIGRDFPDQGYVYFIGHPTDGPVKIGRSKDVPSRLATLRSSSPVPLVVLAAFPTDDEIAAERQLHAILRADRLHGEWFARTPAVLDIIAQYARGV